jgi:arsenate reductase
VWVHEYLKTPPSRDELARLYQRAGISPRQGLRAKEPLAEELGLNRPDVTDDQVLDAMVAHPVLINRPIVETSNGVRLCRPQDLVREIL